HQFQDRDGTVEPISTQSFDTELESWGPVHLQSALWTRPNGHRELLLQLLDGQGHILYTFPVQVETITDEFQSVSAISFKDINGDGRKDVIVIAAYSQLDASKQSHLVTLPLLYLQGEQDFANAFETGEDLQLSKQTGTIADILRLVQQEKVQKTLEKDDWSAALCKQVRSSSLKEEDVVGAYTEAYIKLGWVPGEMGEDRIYGDLGACFVLDTHDRLISNSGLQAHADAVFSAMADINGSLMQAGGIRSGGGTMWSHMGYRSYCIMAYRVNRYVQMKQTNPAPQPETYTKLKQALASSVEELKQAKLMDFEWLRGKDGVEAAQKHYGDAVEKLEQGLQELFRLLPTPDEASVYMLEQAAAQINILNDTW
ncbi:MAG: hypothetical protein K0Q90_4347, partial [Paenibacillaceae bacterium]|nr:hypothetical protein [Paenibacillaceae bacterium]